MSRYGKRRRTEPESDDDLDDDEKEALRAFQEEGFNEDLVNTEEARKKKVEEDLDRKQKESDEDKKRQKVVAERKTKQDEDMRIRREELEKKLSDLRGGLAQTAQAVLEPKNKVVETSAQEQLAEKHPNYKTRLCTRWQVGGCSFGTNCGFAHGGEDMRAQQARLQQMGIPMGMPPPGAPGWPGMQMPGMMQMPPGMMPGYGMPPGQMMPGYMMQGAPQPQVYHHQAQLPPGYVHVPQFPGMMAPATGGAMLPVAGVVVSSTQPPGLGAANSIGGPPPPPPPR